MNHNSHLILYNAASTRTRFVLLIRPVEKLGGFREFRTV
jgi:hypothetical protein